MLADTTVPDSSVVLTVNNLFTELTGTETGKLNVPPSATAASSFTPKEVAPSKTSTFVIDSDFLVITAFTFVIVLLSPFSYIPPHL